MNWRILRTRRTLATLLLGFASGLPLALSGATLQAWLTTEGASLKSIGWFSLAGIPYTWKFLWAPVLDRYTPPWLGRRRGWMVLFQCALALVVLAMSVTAVPSDLGRLAVLAVLLAFLSASLDIVIDAWKTEIFPAAERGVGASSAVVGYRIAMLTSGALALVAAQHFGWRPVFLGLAALTLAGTLATLWAPEPAAELQRSQPASLRDAIVGPIKDLFSRGQAPLLLLLVMTYKLSDAFQLALSSTFLLRGVGFQLEDVAFVNKVVAMLAAIIGVTLGGIGLLRLGLVRALLLFGVLQSLTSLGFVALALRGREFPLLVAAVTLENLASGLGTAAFAALLMGLCSARYSATQYAVLAAISAMGRVYVGPITSSLVEAWGWAPFFTFATFTGIPGLLLVWILRTRISRTEHEGVSS